MPVHKKPTAQDLDRLAAEQVAGISNTQTTHKHSTDDTQTTHEGSTNAVLKRYDVRFAPDDWDQLKRHFESKGLTISAGLRMIAKEYLGKKG